MSDTPRTDEFFLERSREPSGAAMLKLARTLERELAAVTAERDRMRAWLERIEGGDAPCTDESQLRRWAYEAVTLGRAAP